MSAEHRYLTMARTEPIETLRAHFIGSALYMMQHADEFTPEQMKEEADAFVAAEAIARRRQDERPEASNPAMTIHNPHALAAAIIDATTGGPSERG